MLKRLVLAVSLCGVTFGMLPSPQIVRAEEAKFELNDEEVAKVNLTKMVGQSVALTLDSGQEISGTVTKVGEWAVHLSALTGKEFYDAVVPLDRIAVLTIRAKK